MTERRGIREFGEILRGLEGECRFRRLPAHRAGLGLLDLTSNDYLGLAARSAEFLPEFLDRFGDAAHTSSASRLLATDQKVYLDFETLLEELYGRPALLFNSGYHANTGIIRALAIPGTVFLSDKLIHASAIDGLRGRGVEFDRWRHNDTGHLRKLLEKYAQTAERMVVIVESVYSMDGDLAPLEELAALREEFPTMILMLDEAHGFGVFGQRGLGLAEERGLLDRVDILVATLGKAAAGEGAFAVSSQLMKDYFINTARSLIFSTAISPSAVAWSRLMVEKLTDMDAERQRVRELGARVRTAMQRRGYDTGESASQIVPVITGDAARALDLAREFEERGILVSAIRRPTVPAGGERIRISLTAAITDEGLSKLLAE